MGYFIIGIILLALTREYRCKPSYYGYSENQSPSYHDHQPPAEKQPQEENIWRFQFNVPKILNKLRTYTGINVKSGSKNDNYDPREKPIGRERPSSNDPLSKIYTVEVKPDMDKLLNYVKTIIPGFRKRFNINKTFVDEDCGTIKSPPYSYPKDLYANKIAHLMKLKKIRDAAAIQKHDSTSD